ncbi:hypothetical protein [Prauserella cavernicola]|uniref:Secreted protein n=1 Tax=Prauserella cavernicola TaxID=2800127 RepID=A0A934V5V9_9PSEU|nr:hypothetical protein [Prauserella cavernicola]MBK1786084.1 hypothetical protein [Prauserella cavernicola]
MAAKPSQSNREERATRFTIRNVCLTAAAALATTAFVAAPAHAASANEDVRVQECGLSQINQTYEVCGPGNRWVSIVYFDSSTKSTGNVDRCWGPGLYQMINELGPFRVGVNSTEGVPC